MENYNLPDLLKKRPTVSVLDLMLEYNDKGLGCMSYSDGTLIVDGDGFKERPQLFAELRYELLYRQNNILNFGVTDTQFITKEINRARLLDNNDSSDIDDSEAQATAEDIVTYAVAYGCSDVHIFLRNPNVEIRFNQNGFATEPVFPSFDYPKLTKMVARLFNWTGANNSTGDFSLKSIQATTLTIDINIDDHVIPTRLRIEKTPLEKMGDAKIVFRVSPAVQSKTLSDMKVNPIVANVLSQHMKKPSGLIVVSGPTGMGKTTLLHGCLHEIPTSSFCSTIEDPVEVSSSFNPLISQHNLDKNIGFEGQLKSLLRQDPNIIVNGEIRDEESAKGCAKTALTGHLVITTLHTSNALGIPSRLDELGVSYKFQALPDVLSLLIAIRLAPVLCESCCLPAKKNHQVYELLKVNSKAKVENINVKNNRGCKRCTSGIISRKPIIEYIVVDNIFREFLEKGDINNAGAYLKSQGWQSLQDLIWIEINKGIIDPQDAESVFKDILYSANDAHIYKKQWFIK
jgi:type II secretory ATPase GspE/PulE/Tfp pilus assembly ATPase PilB-like protein